MKSLLPFLFLFTSCLLVNAQKSGSYKALSFNGSSDDVELPDDTLLNPSKYLTVEAWVKAEAFASQVHENTIVCKHTWDNGRERGYVLRAGAGGKVSFNIGSNGNSWQEAVSTNTVLTTGKWYHVAGTYDGDTVKVYVNGKLEGFKAYKGTMFQAFGHDAKVGELSYGSGRNWYGEIDEVRIWDTILTQKELQQQMCSKINAKHAKYKNLVAYWKFDDASGSSVKDYGPKSLNATINGAKWVNSGAAIGDTSVYITKGKQISLLGKNGDEFSINNIAGKYSAVHLYANYVGDDAEAPKGLMIDSSSSFGVYFDKGSGNYFGVNYQYAKNSMYTKSKSCWVEMAKKPLPLDSVFTNAEALYYTSYDSISLSKQTYHEYAFALYDINRITTSTGDSSFCDADSLELFAPGSSKFSFIWYKDKNPIKGATKSSLMIKQKGIYQVAIARNKSCTYTTKPMEIKVISLPSVSLSSIGGVCIDQSSFQIKGASPKGGVFSGSVVDKDGVVLPSKQKAGTYPIKYSFTNSFGCVASASDSISIYDLPTITFSSTPKVCNNVDTLSLNHASPAGGVYSGDGVKNNKFYPKLASKASGVFKITYSYTDVHQCSNTATVNLRLVRPTNLVFKAITSDSTICQNNDPVAFDVTPNKGTFTGDGVSGKKFDPSIVAKGTYTIVYTFSNIDDCISTAKRKITVNSPPTASLSGVQSICRDNNDTLILSNGLPKGGFYLGQAVVQNNKFYPAKLAVGQHDVSYVYTHPKTGCSDTAKGAVEVLASDSIKLSAIPTLCAFGTQLNLAKYSQPTGGDYSGDFTTSNGVFNTNKAKAGHYTVTYTYQNSDKCISKKDRLIQVNELPNVSLTGRKNICNNEPEFALKSSPYGGVFNYNSTVVDSVFKPSDYSLGKHIIYYTYKDVIGCSNSDSLSILVKESPIIKADDATVCINDDSLNLNYFEPKGGAFKSPYIQKTIFSASKAGLGKHSVLYSYTNDDKCTDSARVSIEVLESPNPATISQDGDKLISSITSNIQWYELGKGMIPSATNASYEPTKSGKYYVVNTDAKNGCTGVSEVFNFIHSGIYTINQIASIYPNPAHDYLQIQLKEAHAKAELHIYSLNGALLKNVRFANSKSTIMLSDLPKGSYLMTISINGNLYREKLIVY